MPTRVTEAVSALLVVLALLVGTEVWQNHTADQRIRGLKEVAGALPEVVEVHVKCRCCPCTKEPIK